MGDEWMSEPWAQNTLGLDFRAEAELLGEPAEPIVDVHTHINGAKAAEIWAAQAKRAGYRSHDRPNWCFAGCLFVVVDGEWSSSTCLPNIRS